CGGAPDMSRIAPIRMQTARSTLGQVKPRIVATSFTDFFIGSTFLHLTAYTKTAPLVPIAPSTIVCVPDTDRVLGLGSLDVSLYPSPSHLTSSAALSGDSSSASRLDCLATACDAVEPG